MSHDIVFSLAVGDENIAKKSKYLVKSIRRNYADAPILAYLVESERSQLSSDTVAFFREKTTLHVGKFPNSEYPISSKLKAMMLASNEFNFEYLVLLDSDTIVVDKIEKYLNNTRSAEVYVKPVDGSGKWDSVSEWEEVISEMNYSMPSYNTVSTVDKNRIFPFYNAGVVITTNSKFPLKWLDLTLAVYDTAEKGDIFFSDQVALGLLSQTFEFREMSEIENYPVWAYRFVPKDATILHYHRYETLTKIKNAKHVKILDEIKINERIPTRASIVSRFNDLQYDPNPSWIQKLTHILKRGFF